MRTAFVLALLLSGPASLRVFDISVTNADETRTASCTLIHRDVIDGRIAHLYFITAASLFDGGLGSAVIRYGGQPLPIFSIDVLVPADRTGLALVRAVAPATVDFAPEPVMFSDPQPGSVFEMSADRCLGSPVTIDGTVFGVVVACDGRRRTVVTLSLVERFLIESIPDLEAVR